MFCAFFVKRSYPCLMNAKYLLSFVFSVCLPACLFTQGGWTQKANFAGTSRLLSVGFSIGTKGYIGTGRDASGDRGDFWEWDQTTDSWTQKASIIGTARGSAVGFSIGTKGYIGTGVSGSSPTFTHHQDFYEWDQATNTWAIKANFGGMGRENAVGFSIGSKGYIGTGWASNPWNFSPFYKDFWEWDQATNAWTQKADFGGGLRAGAIGYATSSKGYIGTGWDNVLGAHNDFWEYDPSTNIWIQKTNLPGVPRDMAVAFHIGNNGYVGTGTTQMSGGVLSDFYKYDPTSNSWSTLTSFSGGLRSHSASFSIGCYGYITTGSLNLPNTYKNDLWEFYDSTNAFCCILSATAFGATTICAGQIATLSAVGGNNYSWSNGATSAVITVTPTTTTTYTVIETSGICTDTASVSVTVLPSPPVANISGNISICLGQAATFSASGGGTYSWNNGQTTSSVFTYPNMSVTYTVIVSIGMCSDTATASVTLNQLPVVSISGNTVLCSGQSTTLTASGGGTYLWSNGATNNSISITPTFTTGYNVIVTSPNGCTAQTNSQIVVNQIPVANANPSTICAGDSTTISVSGGSNYLWNTGAITPSIQIAPNVSTNYSVIVSIGNCTDTAFTYVTVNPLPAVNAATNTTITYGQNATLIASGGANYSWSNGDNGNTIVVSPSSTTVYCVSVTDANNCSDTACVTVTFIDVCNADIYLPNAFSPNDDGENDFLQVFYENIVCITSLHMVLYNRHGEKVYETNDPAFRWNGLYNGGILKRDQVPGTEVCTFYLTATLINNKEVSMKGNISIVR